MSTMLYLLVIIAKLSKKIDQKTLFDIQQIIYQMNKLNIVNKDGSSLLHMAVNPQTPVDSFHTDDICK